MGAFGALLVLCFVVLSQSVNYTLKIAIYSIKVDIILICIHTKMHAHISKDREVNYSQTVYRK